MNVRKFLKQYAVYWAPKAMPEETGETGYEDPVEIRVRWTDKQELQVEASPDENWMSSAEVIVDRPVELQGVLWKGRFNRLTNPAKPFENEGAALIEKYEEVPDKNATDRGTLRTATL